MNLEENHEMIDNFENRYCYDSTYMRELLESSPKGFEKFTSFLPLAGHIELLTSEDYWVAKLVAMQVEDCGECLQLSVRMALEAGIDSRLISDILNGGATLPEPLKEVYAYAKYLAKANLVDPGLMDKMEQRYSKGELLEFGICIATAKVFPTIKNAVGYKNSCKLTKIEI